MNDLQLFFNIACLVVFGFLFAVWEKEDGLNLFLKLVLLAMLLCALTLVVKSCN